MGAGAPVGTVVVGVPVSIGGSVGISVGILHSTWEGSGLHLPLLPHVALRYDGTRFGCSHWKIISEFTTVLVYGSTITPLARVGGSPQSTMLAGEEEEKRISS